MFRPRRPFRGRPPMGRPPRRAPRPAIPLGVAEAQHLERAGHFAAAARDFDELAAAAQARGDHGDAAELYARAARAYLLFDDPELADNRAECAVLLFIEAGCPERVRQLLPRVLPALERQGRQGDADRLRHTVAEAFRDVRFQLEQYPARARAAADLPAKCPGCGAPVRAGEVAWAGPTTAECPYCAGAIKAASDFG